MAEELGARRYLHHEMDGNTTSVAEFIPYLCFVIGYQGTATRRRKEL